MNFKQTERDRDTDKEKDLHLHLCKKASSLYGKYTENSYEAF